MFVPLCVFPLPLLPTVVTDLSPICSHPIFLLFSHSSLTTPPHLSSHISPLPSHISPLTSLPLTSPLSLLTSPLSPLTSLSLTSHLSHLPSHISSLTSPLSHLPSHISLLPSLFNCNNIHSPLSFLRARGQLCRGLFRVFIAASDVQLFQPVER